MGNDLAYNIPSSTRCMVQFLREPAQSACWTCLELAGLSSACKCGTNLLFRFGEAVPLGLLELAAKSTLHPEAGRARLHFCIQLICARVDGFFRSITCVLLHPEAEFSIACFLGLHLQVCTQVAMLPLRLGLLLLEE